MHQIVCRRRLLRRSGANWARATRDRRQANRRRPPEEGRANYKRLHCVGRHSFNGRKWRTRHCHFVLSGPLPVVAGSRRAGERRRVSLAACALARSLSRLGTARFKVGARNTRAQVRTWARLVCANCARARAIGPMRHGRHRQIVWIASERRRQTVPIGAGRNRRRAANRRRAGGAHINKRLNISWTLVVRWTRASDGCAPLEEAPSARPLGAGRKRASERSQAHAPRARSLAAGSHVNGTLMTGARRAPARLSVAVAVANAAAAPANQRSGLLRAQVSSELGRQVCASATN